MLNVIKLIGFIFLTAAGLAVFTDCPDGVASSRVLGLPVVVYGQVMSETPGWLAFGQVASGVLVFAQGGMGVVVIAQGGVGIVFGVGQLMTGLLAVAQLGIGLFGFLGQVGFGAQAIGQGVFRSRSIEYFTAMSAEFNEALSFAWPLRAR